MNETLIYSLLQGVQRENPRIHDLIRELIQTIQIHNNELFPELPTVIPPQIDTEPPVLEAPLNFRYTLIEQGIHFEWDRPSSVAVFFEIRKGDTWEDGLRQVVTPTLDAVLFGQPVGIHTYWIKSYDEDGNASPTATRLDVEIPPIGEVAVSGYVVDNFVLLQWVEPESAFKIDYYIISRNGTQIGEQRGTFITWFEDTGGTYTYSVRAVDIYGNVSNDATIDLIVSQPADYVLYDVFTDDFLGTRVNVYRDATLPSIFASLDLTETWQQYADNGWATMQDEIDDNLPYWLQPTVPSVGMYTRIADFGAPPLEAIICNVSWAYHEIVPFTSVRCFMSSSVDNVAWTAETETKTLFIPIFRYVKVRFEFLALN